MRFDPSGIALDGATALLFPGQGAHRPTMLESFRHAPSFERLYAQVCELLGDDPLAVAERDPAALDRNAWSSLLTVVASLCCLELLRHALPALVPLAVAGYSVGQWTALCAAGSLEEETLLRVLHRRAQLMDECVAAAEPSGMLAVIGVRQTDVERVCTEVTAGGGFLEIANDNAPGQLSLGGSAASLDEAEERLRAFRPKRLQRLPVAGAWHSALLAPASPRLAALLAETPLDPPSVPVIDNTSGAFLPSEPAALRGALARQVAAPVRWRQGVATLAAAGATTLLEVGYGDVLTMFGFFIDRSLTHRAAVPLPRPLP